MSAGLAPRVALLAPASLERPDFERLHPDVFVRTRPRARLTDVYFDTPDLRLARAGVELRQGAADGWVLALPPTPRGLASRRRAVPIEGAAGAVPPRAAALVTGYRRSAELDPVARLDTEREQVELFREGGEVLAVLTDDRVRAQTSGGGVESFRELGVAVRVGAGEWLAETVLEALLAAGAGPVQDRSRLAHALGPAAAKPPDVVVPRVGSNPTAESVIRRGSADATRRLVRHEPGVRIGEDAEDVHQARVATRRLRSILRTFEPLLDREWAASLRSELGGLAAALGRVRDRDVLLARLRERARELPPEADAGATPLFARLAAERAREHAALVEALGRTGHVELIDRLVAAAAEPRMRRRAMRPADEMLPPVLIARWKTLRHAVREARRTTDPVRLHVVRIRAKQCRYAASAMAPAFGPAARSLSRALASLQGVLGDVQDSVVAEAWLREAAADLETSEAAFVAGLLAGVEIERRGRERSRWRRDWKRVKKRWQRLPLGGDGGV